LGYKPRTVLICIAYQASLNSVHWSFPAH